jgi:hypothetical protein
MPSAIAHPQFTQPDAAPALPAEAPGYVLVSLAPDGSCRVEFCRNDPVNLTDPTGLVPKEEALTYLKSRAIDIYNASGKRRDMTVAIMSTMYVELRRTRLIDRLVDVTSSKYVRFGAKGNSYGPAQITPAFAETIIN